MRRVITAAIPSVALLGGLTLMVPAASSGSLWPSQLQA